MSSLSLDFDLHELECPHCQKRTQHAWPGSTIPLSTAKCKHCGAEFLVFQSKPWVSSSGSNGQRV
jgi:DNA-directed RNA polymerase subunit RPC12/RpoP